MLVERSHQTIGLLLGLKTTAIQLVAWLFRTPLRAVGMTLMVMLAVAFANHSAVAQDEAKAAEGPPLKIGIFLTEGANLCKGSGNLNAVTRFTTTVQERINEFGGVNGFPIEVKFYTDDPKAPDKTISQVETFAKDERSLAILGLTDELVAYRAYAKVVDVSQAGEKKVLPVTMIADAPLAITPKQQKSLFSLVPSRASVRDPVIAAFIKKWGFEHVAIVGMKRGFAKPGLSETVVEKLEKAGIVVSQYTLSEDNLTVEDGENAGAREAVIKQIISLKSQPGLIVFDAPTGSSGLFITELKQKAELGPKPDWKPQLFFPEGLAARPFAFIEHDVDNLMFGLVWDKLPESNNTNLRNQIARGIDKNWVFECDGEGALVNPDPFYHKNLAAINLGTRYADMINLIAAAIKAGNATSDVSNMRSYVKEALETNYRPGQRKFKGIFRNWSFDNETHSVDRMPFVEIHPASLLQPQLSPHQFVRLQDKQIVPIDTVYLDIDLIRAHGINDNEKTFFAEFYLAVRATDEKSAPRDAQGKRIPQIDRIEFANAYLDPKAAGGRELTITSLHDGSKNPAFPEQMELYKVSGRFFFDPRLSHFPFDVQQFPIDIQPKQADKAFIIQPPPADLRDTNVVVEGWLPRAQYVGSTSDFVPVVNAYSLKPAIVPFYKSSFVWQMKREVTDYFLRVVVPLAFILIVAYLSIFIPQTHLEAIVTIQITALLAAVALYLSLPQLETDSATISDRIFVFDYMMISIMIMISILRINARIQKVRWLDGTLSFVHITLIPAAVAYMAYWVYMVTVLQKQT